MQYASLIILFHVLQYKKMSNSDIYCTVFLTAMVCVRTNNLAAHFAILTNYIEIKPRKDEGMVPVQRVRVSWRILTPLPGAEAAKKAINVMRTLQCWWIHMKDFQTFENKVHLTP